MKRVLVILALVALVSSMAGCLGGGDDGGGSTKRASTAQGSANVTGEALLDGMVMNPEDLTHTVDVNLPDTGITFILFNITILDQAGAENENKPDEVKSVVIGERNEANYEVSAGGGQTTYEKQVAIEWNDEDLISPEWAITMTVTCNPDDDGWVGPFIYQGYQDTGFSYNIEVSYEYRT